MRLIIAGGRNYRFTDRDIGRLDVVHETFYVTEVVSGGASGADQCGEEWAVQNKLPVKRFNADWNRLGKSAGPTRNRQMAEYANACALFPGGKGTDDMARAAQDRGLIVFDWRVRDTAEVVQRALAWLATPEGQAAQKEAKASGAAFRAALEQSRDISWEKLLEPYRASHS